MSTVPEAIVARQCGLKVAAVSCITNLAAGPEPGNLLSHAEVLETAERVKKVAAQLLSTVCDSVWPKAVNAGLCGRRPKRGSGRWRRIPVQSRRGAAHPVRRDHHRRQRGERQLRADLLRRARGAVQGADRRQEGFRGGGGGCARAGRADALRRLPPVAGRIRARGDGLGGRQPGALQARSGIFGQQSCCPLRSRVSRRFGLKTRR